MKNMITKYADAYYNSGFAYGKKGDYDKVIVVGMK